MTPPRRWFLSTRAGWLPLVGGGLLILGSPSLGWADPPIAQRAGTRAAASRAAAAPPVAQPARQIPSDEAAIELHDAHFPQLGLTVAPSPGAGVLVVEVRPRGPADRAGLHAGDFIVSLEDEAISSPSQLREALQDMAAGGTIKLTLWRRGARSMRALTVPRRAAPSAEDEANPSPGTTPSENPPPGWLVPGEDVDQLQQRITGLQRELDRLRRDMRGAHAQPSPQGGLEAGGLQGGYPGVYPGTAAGAGMGTGYSPAPQGTSGRDYFHQYGHYYTFPAPDRTTTPQAQAQSQLYQPYTSTHAPGPYYLYRMDPFAYYGPRMGMWIGPYWMEYNY